MVKASARRNMESWQVMSELLAADSAIELLGNGKRGRSVYTKLSLDNPHPRRLKSSDRWLTPVPSGQGKSSNSKANAVFVLPEPIKPKKMKWAYTTILIFILVSLGVGFGYVFVEHNALIRHAEARDITIRSFVSEETLITLPPDGVAQAISVSYAIMATTSVLVEVSSKLEEREVLPDYTYACVEPIAPVLLSPMPRLEFLELRRAFGNEDIVGHLRIEGTAINYLVVQAADNDFYLRRDIWKNRSSAGWIFLDYAVDLRGRDQNIVIYGHNMGNGTMFHNIRRYANYSFFRNNSIIRFSTIYSDYVWEVFAFYSAHISFPYTMLNFPNEATHAHMLEQFMSRSIHSSGITVTPSDRILTLSTCTNVNKNDRLVLQARLLQPGL